MQLRYFCIAVLIAAVFTSNAQTTYDASLDSLGFEYQEYPLIPLTQIDPFDFHAKVKSIGSGDVTNTKVYVSGSYSDSVVLGDIAYGNSSSGNTTSSYSPSTIGNKSFYINTVINESDIDLTNNVDTIGLEITQRTMAREYNAVTGGIGYNGSSGPVGNRFKIKGDTVTSVSFYIFNPPAGDSVKVHIHNYSNGVGTLVQSSDHVVLSASQNWYTLPLKCPAILSDGEYLVSVDQLVVGSNMSLGYTLDFYTDSSAFYNGGGAGWNTLESAGFEGTLLIRVNFGSIEASINASADTICEGQSADLEAFGGKSWTWSPAGSLSSSSDKVVTASPTTTTKYYLTSDYGCSNVAYDSFTLIVEKNPTGTISSDTTICIGGTASLKASGGSSYKWGGGPANGNWNVSPKETKFYTVTIDSTNGCNTELGTFVAVSVPEVIAYKDTMVCAGTSVQFTADRASTYQWEDGPATSSYNYTVNGKDTLVVFGYNHLGCEASDSVFLDILPSPSVVPMTDTGACFAQYVHVKTQSVADEYEWSNGSDSSSAVIHVLLSKNYILKLTTNNGCSAYDTVFVERYLPPAGSIDPDTTICLNESLTISAYGGATYEWDNGETTPAITVSPEEETTYNVTIYSDKGCTDFDDITVSIDPLAEPAFKVNTFKDSVVFTNQSQVADSFHWDFGDGNTSTEENPYNIYDTSGSYTVTLTAFNNCGGVDSSFTINVVVPQSGSVTENSQFINFKVYPIPTHESVKYSLSNQLFGDYNIEVQDISGRTIFKEQGYKSSNELNGTINLSEYANGVYILKVQIGESASSKRLIKN